MTAAVVLAAEVERIAREIVASMAVFHRLNPSQRTALAAGGDILVEHLHEAWAAFVAQQWKEREPKSQDGPIVTVKVPGASIEIG